MSKELEKHHSQRLGLEEEISLLKEGIKLTVEQRALAAIIVNMLIRHTHEQRQGILRFALAQEQFIPVSKASVFAGTAIMPGESPGIG